MEIISNHLVYNSRKRKLKTMQEDKVYKKEYSMEDVDFRELNEENIITNLICSICTNVCNNPSMIKHCQHTFCRDCIERHHASSNSKSCPICRVGYDMNDVIKSIIHCSLIDNLKVNCLHAGCSWKGIFQSLKNHLRESCTMLYLCDCSKIIQISEKENHQKSCPLFKIKCICGEMIERAKIQDHLAEDCPSSNVYCEYEPYGCLWKGTRKEYKIVHQCACKVRQLHRDLVQAKKGGSEDPIMKVYRKSDCFTITGLRTDNTTRKKLMLKYVQSKLDLGFPIRIGKIDSQGDYTVSITGITISGIFDFDTKKTNNRCIVDINMEEAVMAITFQKNRDRLFVIATKGANPKVKKLQGGRIRVEFQIDKKQMSLSPVIYAHREWCHLMDGKEYHFTIEPSSRYIDAFNLYYEGSKIDNDALHTKILEFLHLPAWNSD